MPISGNFRHKGFSELFPSDFIPLSNLLLLPKLSGQHHPKVQRHAHHPGNQK